MTLLPLNSFTRPSSPSFSLTSLSLTTSPGGQCGASMPSTFCPSYCSRMQRGCYRPCSRRGLGQRTYTYILLLAGRETAFPVSGNKEKRARPMTTGMASDLRGSRRNPSSLPGRQRSATVLALHTTLGTTFALHMALFPDPGDSETHLRAHFVQACRSYGQPRQHPYPDPGLSLSLHRPVESSPMGPILEISRMAKVLIPHLPSGLCRGCHEFLLGSLPPRRAKCD